MPSPQRRTRPRGRGTRTRPCMAALCGAWLCALAGCNSPASLPVGAASAEPAKSVAQRASTATAGSSGGRRALLIGVNDYLGVPDLRGALNDVELLREVLISRFGFDPDDIETVLEAQADRAGILAAFDRLAERVEPGDLVYVHYSGHGSQTADLDGDEADGKDETIIPRDGRTPGIPDITDDEIGDMLAALDAERVVVVLDSCHSGTATRGLGAQSQADALRGALTPRYVPPDTRTELYATRTRSVVPLVSSGHILFTGAAHDEEALDGPVDLKPHGLFSYALGKSLARVPATASAREVFDGVDQEFERIRAQLSLRVMPDPQLEAESGDIESPLFATSPKPDSAGAPEPAASEAARLAWIPASPEGAGRVRLERGSALGAGRGSLWALYPPGELEFAPGGALAEAEVTRLEGSDAIARLDPADAEIAAGARAVALAPPPASSDIPFAVVDADGARRQALEQALSARFEGVRFVGPGEFARFVLRCRDRCTLSGADGLFPIAELPADDVDELAGRLANLLARSLTAAELVALDNPTAAFDVELSVVGSAEPTGSAGDERGMLLVAATDAPVFRVRREGEPRTRENSLQLRVVPREDCHLTLVDVDSEGNILVLFPNPLSEAKGYYPGGALVAGEEFLLPDSLEADNRAGFHIDYAPPAGTDTVRAFCMRDPGAARALRATIASLDPSRPVTRSAKSRRLGSLRGDLARLASRGLVLVPSGSESQAPAVAAAQAAAEGGEVEEWYADWAAASATIEVRE